MEIAVISRVGRCGEVKTHNFSMLSLNVNLTGDFIQDKAY